jgi:two-component system, sensor histidine kinase
LFPAQIVKNIVARKQNWGRMRDHRDLSNYIEVMLMRRSRLGVRLTLGFAVSVTALWFISPVSAACWFVAYSATQGLERWLFTPQRISNLQVFPRWRRIAVSLAVLQGCMFGICGAMAEAGGGIPSRGLAVTLVGVAMMINVTASRGSRTAFLDGFIPESLFMVVIFPLVTGWVTHTPSEAIEGIFIGLIAVAAAWLARREYDRVLLAADIARAEAEQRKAEAESATAAKSAFVAMVSHELRTPITAIQAGAAAMHAVAADASQRDHAGLILEAGRMMRTLLDDLLDLSKLEAGRMTVEATAFDARLVLRNTAKFWRSEAQKRNVRLALSGMRSLPQWILGDPTRIRQILNNLLSNAFKFTSEGVVRVRFAQPIANTIAISVEDSGAGMSDVQMAKLFKAFSQADETVSRTHGGTGLGLAISRDLAQLMEGDLSVKSAVGQGSTFTLTFPLRLTAAPVVADEPNSVPTADGNVLRVLVVDDHEINLRALTLLLQPLGAELTLASGGLEALECMAISPFDAVLIDVHMPVLGGVEVARRIRSQPGPNRDTPIVAVTGAAEETAVARYREAGMDDCVVKPVQAADLYAALDRVLTIQEPDRGAHGMRHDHGAGQST